VLWFACGQLNDTPTTADAQTVAAIANDPAPD
jgi:hypothetical protein